MSLFEGVLLTVDYDRTLTGPDSKIPQRNLEAIAFFMENGGRFTVNTGRSVASFGRYLQTTPANAPFILYNGSAWYEDGKLTNMKIIDLDMWETVTRVVREFPDMNMEIQGMDKHYLFKVRPEYDAFCEALKWPHRMVEEGEDLGPFLKFALVGTPRAKAVATLFDSTEEEIAAFDAAEKRILELYGDKVTVYRAAHRIIDVHATGVSKGAAARELQQKLGCKILVCVGDAPNDSPMLDEADYAYCPADGVVADRYENVCPCAEGAVADVIYEKIPGILNISLDSRK